MNEKERLQLENELLMTCSKAQAINKYIDELEENSKLSELWCKSQNNWNKLKEWLEEDTEEHYYNFEMGRCFNYRDILDKMQEIEGGMNE